jgi:hypothetical protein
MNPIGSRLKSTKLLNASVLCTPNVKITNVLLALEFANDITGVAFGDPVPPVKFVGI